MKIVRYDNPSVTATTDTLQAALLYGATSVTVSDGTSFSADDLILIEEVGHEKCEIVQITDVTSNTLTITATVLPHANGTTITKVNYDKYKITKCDTIGGTYSTVTTSDLDYANKYNIIDYTDDDCQASDLLYYKIYYYNSVTDTADLQDTLFDEKNYGYIDVENFRAETAFTDSEVSNAEIEKAIYTAGEWIQDNAYVYHEFNASQDTVFLFNTDLEFADWNLDKSINKNDIIVYEYDNSTYMRRYLAHKIAKIIPDSKKIIFQESVPIDTTNDLIFKIPVTFKKYGEIKYILKSISKLIATNWILMNVDTSKIKNGVTSWTAGGTSVNRDLNNLKESIDKNLTEARRLLTQVTKIYTKTTKLRTRQSSLNYRTRYRSNIITEGGNVYHY